MTTHYDGTRLMTRRGRVRVATPLVAVLIAVATTDVLFAIDSVPAVFAVTTNAFIVFSANAFSVLGLRPMYFLLAGALERFRHLKYGLSAVLVFVGLKMLAADVVHVPVRVSLAVIAVLLGASVLASLRRPPGPVEPPRAGPAAALGDGPPPVTRPETSEREGSR